MQSINQHSIQLQQRLTTGADHKLSTVGRPVQTGFSRPLPIDRPSQLFGRLKLSAASAINTNKIGIAKSAHRRRPVALAPRPEIAARKAAEDGRPAGVSPFTLECVEDFLD
jgi:hypothetical protein